MKLRHGKDALEVEVPASLLDFLRKWSKDGEHKIDHCALSLFSHGLISLAALNDYQRDLLEAINPVLHDMCAQAPDKAHVLEVDLTPEPIVRVRN